MFFKPKFATGCVPDTIDERDHIFDGLGAPKVDWEHGYDIEQELGYQIPIKDQNGSSSCVGQGVAYYVGVLNAVEMGMYKEVSAKAIYSQIYLPQGGAYIRDAMKLAVNWGSLYEYIVSSYIGDKAPNEKFMRKIAWKNESYNPKVLQAKEYRVIQARDDMDMFAGAIMANHGVVGGVYGDNDSGWDTGEPQPPKTKKWAHCFLANQKVLTSDGYKNIQDITVGNFVLTHKNRFKRVVKIGNKEYSGNICKISTCSSIDDIIATEEHPFYCMFVGKKHISEVLEEDKQEYQFLKLSEIIRTDNKRMLYDNLFIEGILPEKQNSISENIAFLLGVFIGDGNLAGRKRKDGTVNYKAIRFIIGINKRNGKLREKVISLMEKEFGLLPRFYNPKGANCEQIIFYSKKIADFFLAYCGKPRNKKIHSDILLSKKSVLKEFAEGWFMTDGCLVESQNKKMISTSSKDLAYSLSVVLNKLGYAFSVQQRPEGKTVIQDRIVFCKESWHFSYREYSKRTQSWFHNGYKLVRPKKIETTFFEGTVYNFEVEEDNSYTVGNLIVHNCLFYGAFGTDSIGRYISTPNSWGGSEWQKLRANYFTQAFQFNPWTLVDKPNPLTEGQTIIKEYEKKVIIEGEGKGRKGIIINGKFLEIKKDRVGEACLYALANNGFGVTVSTETIDELIKGDIF